MSGVVPCCRHGVLGAAARCGLNTHINVYITFLRTHPRNNGIRASQHHSRTAASTCIILYYVMLYYINYILRASQRVEAAAAAAEPARPARGPGPASPGRS